MTRTKKKHAVTLDYLFTSKGRRVTVDPVVCFPPPYHISSPPPPFLFLYQAKGRKGGRKKHGQAREKINKYSITENCIAQGN